MTSRLDGLNDGARPSANLPNEPEAGEIARHEGKAGIPSLSDNPRGVRARGSLVSVREDDLAALVFAARDAAAEVRILASDRDSRAKLNALDKASEGMVDLFPWRDPEDAGHALKVGEVVPLPGSPQQRFTALVSENRELIVQTETNVGSSAMIFPAVTVRALALLERRIP